MERMERIDAARKIADFQAKMQMPYDFKVKYATIRAREFVAECDRRGLDYHVSVGGAGQHNASAVSSLDPHQRARN